jgi:hypothetical protein
MLLCKEVWEITIRDRKLCLISGRYDVRISEYIDPIYGWVDRAAVRSIKSDGDVNLN